LHIRLAAVHQGTGPGRAGRRLTVKEILDAYETNLQARGKKSIDKILSHLKPVRAALDGERVLELTVDKLNTYIAQRRAMHAATGTITQEMIFLRAALRLAHRHQRILYLPYVPTAGQGGVRKGFVDVDLFDRIHAVMPPPYSDMAEFAYLTGWRYEEVCGLELAWVFLADAEIRLPDSKNGQGRVIVLEGRLQELVQKWWAGRRLDCPYLFHRNGRRVKDALREHWRTACVTVGIAEVKHRGPTGWRSFAGVSIHDLRRSAIRNMRRAGVAESVAMTISGHQSPLVFKRYDITSHEDQRSALAATEAYRAQRRAAKVTPLNADKTRTARPAAHA
jgi:integrase